MFYRINTLFLLLLLPLSLSFSQEIQDPISASEHQQLNEIGLNIQSLMAQREALEAQLNGLEDPEEIEEINKSIDTLTQRKHEYERVFEKISLGGLDTARFETATGITDDTEGYDWQKELVIIMQPVFSEMQRLTEGPRKRELLRVELKEISERITLLKEGLNYLTQLKSDELTSEALEKINRLEEEWQLRLENLQHQKTLVSYDLEDLTDDHTFFERISASVIRFATGRGLILLVSFSAFFGVFYLFSKGLKLMARNRERHGKARPISIRWRVALLAYQLVMVIASLFVLLTLLHSSGDMVLFGLAIIILLLILISMRNAIPAYLQKLRLFLNLGQAREGERVIYNGIPWKIEYINLYTVYLLNPALDNGRIRLTVDILNGMVSRPIKHNEIWFPSKVGESFIMPDGLHVVVKRQTPESVYLDYFGGHIIYPTADFIKAKPNNISQGYSTTVNFGLGYEHFSLSIDDVIATIRTKVEAALKERGMLEYTTGVTVDFRRVEAGESLLYTIIVGMGHDAVGFYYSLPRLIQKVCVETAQENGWNLPFTEVSLRRDHKITLPEGAKMITADQSGSKSDINIDGEVS